MGRVRLLAWKMVRIRVRIVVCESFWRLVGKGGEGVIDGGRCGVAGKFGR